LYQVLEYRRWLIHQEEWHAGIWIETLWCGHTTEAGEDEIYFLVASKKSDGTAHTSRLPGPNEHVDMNDSGPKQDRNHINLVLWEGDLADGESVIIYTAIMEEDGGIPGDLLQTIGAGVGEIGGGNPISDIASGILTGVGSILNLSGIRDTDDFPGSFAVHLTNAGGRLVQQWKAVERAKSIGVPPNHPEAYKPWELLLEGDGSNYRVYLRAEPR
jgi:hypothetical protein